MTGILMLIIVVAIGYIGCRRWNTKYSLKHAKSIAPDNYDNVLMFDYYFDKYDAQKLNLSSTNAAIYSMPNHTVQFEPSNDQQQFYLINVYFSRHQKISGNISGSRYISGHVDTTEIPSIALLTLVTPDKQQSFDIRMEMDSDSAEYLRQYFMLNSFQKQQLGFN